LQGFIRVIMADRKRNVAWHPVVRTLTSLPGQTIVHDLLLHLCRLRDIGIGDRLSSHLAEQRVNGNAIADKIEEGARKVPTTGLRPV